MRFQFLKDIKKVYFIGIGGVSMSALAKFLSVNGYEVSGSDARRGESTEDLAFYNIKLFIGEDNNREELIHADAIVYTDAILKNHQELMVASKLHKKIYARMELLAEISKEFKHVTAIAGSHGKTTCTAMCAHILRHAQMPFMVHIGGMDTQLGNYYCSGYEHLVTEACEYKKNLLQLKPERAILLNIDKDHMECYQSEEDLIETFRTYCNHAKTAFVCADDEKCKQLGDFSTFGIHNPLADYRAVNLRSNGERYAFAVEEYGKPIAWIKLNAIGRCNIYNALAAFAAMRSFGFSGEELTKGLESFTAVKRRFEKIGEYRGASFICDYAHHPREILSSLETAKGVCRKKLYVVFQPHTYSRTKLLWREFLNVLYGVDNLMIYKTYPARETYDAEGSAEHLAEAIGCLYAENIYVLKMWIKRTIREGDTVIFLGAGDIYFAAQYLLNELK